MRGVLLLLLLLALRSEVVVAFLLPTSSQINQARPCRVARASHQEGSGPQQEDVTFIKISGPRGGESLPASYAKSFPHWVVGGRGELVRIPKPDTDEGWVEPTSFTELWLPTDLPPPDVRLGLTFVLKDGAPRYIFPALDTLLIRADDATMDEPPTHHVVSSPSPPQQRAWRNRGLNSVPLAKSWLPFDLATLQEAALSVFVSEPPRQSHIMDGNDAGSSQQPELSWSCVVSHQPIQNAVEGMVAALSEAPASLAQGFLYLTVPINEDQLRLPEPTGGGRLRAYLSSREASALHPSGGSSATGFDPESALLDIQWVPVAPGGRSEFLPPVYAPLYNWQGTK